MMRFHAAVVAVFGATLVFGCSSEDDHDHDHDHENGHDHDHDHEDDDDEGHGEEVQFGSITLGDWKVDLVGYGGFEDGREGVITFTLPDGAEGVAAVRAWCGIGSGVGSMKSVISLEDGKYHGHFEVPEAPPEGSEIWVEIELEDGTTVSASVARP